tara:strand:- start:84586 stop:85170 length:585 start_codon:yes stop_codon:yes gene_type:complete
MFSESQAMTFHVDVCKNYEIADFAFIGILKSIEFDDKGCKLTIKPVTVLKAKEWNLQENIFLSMDSKSCPDKKLVPDNKIESIGKKITFIGNGIGDPFIGTHFYDSTIGNIFDTTTGSLDESLSKAIVECAKSSPWRYMSNKERVLKAEKIKKEMNKIFDKDKTLKKTEVLKILIEKGITTDIELYRIHYQNHY